MKISDVQSANGVVTKEKIKGLTRSAMGTMQDSTQSALSTAQRALQKGAKKASEGLQQAQQTMQDRRDAVQDRMARAAARRKRNRTLFRVGLISGLIAALLLTPWPGSETRHQVAEFWRGLFPRQS